LLLSASPLSGLQTPAVLSAYVDAATSPGVSASETAAGDSINAFAQDLYAQLQGEQGGGGNLFMSPFSIATALAMTYGGAAGETATQMADVLHLSQDPNAVANEFGALLSDLNRAGQAGGYALKTADALWGQQGFPFNSAFLNLIQSDYGGGLQQVNYRHPGEAAQTINTWVAGQTNDKIQNLISPDALSAYTRLVLTNAIYFKGNWATAFDSNLTRDANFTLASGDQVNVSMMHQTSSYGYMDSDGYQVLELPYADGRLAMDVILPDAGSGLSGVDISQLPSDLNQWLQGLCHQQQVIVSLPKFTMTTSFQLAQPLEALGMTDAFSNGADFSGITDAHRLKIDAVIHKAFIDVDETGTEAAAATAATIEARCTCMSAPPAPPIEFNADHPFLFTIRDTQTGTVLFMGQEMNPTQDSSDSSAPGVAPVPKATNPAPVVPTPTPTGPNTGTLPAPHAPIASNVPSMVGAWNSAVPSRLAAAGTLVNAPAGAPAPPPAELSPGVTATVAQQALASVSAAQLATLQHAQFHFMDWSTMDPRTVDHVDVSTDAEQGAGHVLALDESSRSDVILMDATLAIGVTRVPTADEDDLPPTG
jgi:serpin B